jgi:hypothetical protein
LHSALREHGVLDSFAARRTVSRCARQVVWSLLALFFAGWWSIAAPLVRGAETVASQSQSDITTPEIDERAPILFGAEEATRWTQGAYDVWVLRGRCYVQQGTTATEANEAVLWVKRGIEFDHERNTVLAYLEGDVRIVDGRTATPFEIRDRVWYGEFTSNAPLQVRLPTPKEGRPESLPKVFTDAQAHRDAILNPAVRPAQFVAPTPIATVVPPAAAPTGRRLRAFSRSSVKVQVKWIPSPNAQEWIGLISPGVNLIIDGIEGFGTLDISTDRMVVWTTGTEEPDLTGTRTQASDRPMEIYMEGNIVFREGDRVIYADRMYYNVNTHVGTILNAEVLTPAPNYSGLVRLKSDMVRQLGEGQFQADSAYVTGSRMANPRYRLQSSQITFQDQMTPVTTGFNNEPVVDPLTGEPQMLHQRLATSRNNFVYLGPVPVFYWPVMATDLDDPQFYLRRVRFKNDQIFGTQVLTDLDMYQMLGRPRPRGHDWLTSIDYLSNRGIAGGTTYRYSGTDAFGMFGPQYGYYGLFDTWGIDDSGLDRLGSDRWNITHQPLRYRIFNRARFQLPDNFQLTSELGVISDRNFLEQFYELEFDTFKDQSTGIELKHLVDNTSWALSADFRVNKFFTQTNQLPRFDHFQLGQSLLGDTLTWFEHSSAEYAQLQIAQTPPDPVEAAKFQLMPWEITSSGERFVTAQEIDAPFLLGPVKFAPYVGGQAGDWGEDLTGQRTQRLYGQAGVRAALPFWSVNPDIQSELFNVNGIAHKIVFDVDASIAAANRNLSQFPMYDQLDDDAQEQFRRRFAFNTFGGTVPPQFDERSFGLRYGLGSYVTSPSAEIADDLAAVRMGIRQRWQTKRGPPTKQRIVDWITLDTQAVYFPKANRDNFGQDFGLVQYDFKWFIGERFSLLSDGGFDFFSQGQSTVSVGAMYTRPTNGNFYLGYRSLNGPFNRQLIIAQANYRLSQKWMGSAGTSFDFSGLGTVGNNFSLIRIGESFLISLNFAYDAFKSNTTVTFNIEPRFLPQMARNALKGVTIPTSGLYGLE